MAEADYPKLVDGRDLSEDQRGALDAFRAAAKTFGAHYRELVERARDLAVAGVDPEPLMGDALLGDDLMREDISDWLDARDRRGDEQDWYGAFGELAEATKLVLGQLDEAEKKAAYQVLQLTLIGVGEGHKWEQALRAQRRLLPDGINAGLAGLSDAESEALSTVLRLETTQRGLLGNTRRRPGSPWYLGTKLAREDVEREHIRSRWGRGAYLLPRAECEARCAANDERIKAEKRAARRARRAATAEVAKAADATGLEAAAPTR